MGFSTFRWQQTTVVASGRVLSPRPPGTLMSPSSPPAKRPTLEKKSDSVRNQFELKTVTVAGAQKLKNVCSQCNGNQSAHHITRLEDHLVGNKIALGKGCLKFLGSKAALKLSVTHDVVKDSMQRSVS